MALRNEIGEPILATTLEQQKEVYMSNQLFEKPISYSFLLRAVCLGRNVVTSSFPIGEVLL